MWFIKILLFVDWCIDCYSLESLLIDVNEHVSRFGIGRFCECALMII